MEDEIPSCNEILRGERGYDMRFKGIEKEREIEAKGSNGVRFPDLTISGC